MIKAEARFGFIGYYVHGELKRVPVQFFGMPTGKIAWLDGGNIEGRLFTERAPVFVFVTRDMDPHEVGNFADVMKFYNREALALFADPRIWQQCIDNDAGVLSLFRTMHEMRANGLNVQEAFKASSDKGLAIRESEAQAERELTALMADQSFLEKPDAIIDVRAMNASTTDRAFILA